MSKGALIAAGGAAVAFLVLNSRQPSVQENIPEKDQVIVGSGPTYGQPGYVNPANEVKEGISPFVTDPNEKPPAEVIKDQQDQNLINTTILKQGIEQLQGQPGTCLINGAPERYRGSELSWMHDGPKECFFYYSDYALNPNDGKDVSYKYDEGTVVTLKGLTPDYIIMPQSVQQTAQQYGIPVSTLTPEQLYNLDKQDAVTASQIASWTAPERKLCHAPCSDGGPHILSIDEKTGQPVMTWSGQMTTRDECLALNDKFNVGCGGFLKPGAPLYWGEEKIADPPKMDCSIQ